MKRVKRHKIKSEQPESSSQTREQEHDLAYYIHDRVELMHQVFSVLKYKDLKAMAPECIRNLPIGDLQELCTEELLGISSKRLLAILDGAEPPSDTESSSESPTPERMETISLDSISSDDEILSQASKKKKHKHRRNSKSKKKKGEKEAPEREVSQASRAGLTVLELLELQARARAIRAQLHNEQAKKQSELVITAAGSSDDEVEIKEERPDVVEISSGDEKPDIEALQRAAEKTKEPQKSKEITPKPKEVTPKPKESTSKDPKTKSPEKTDSQPKETDKENGSERTTVTRRISDLVITVPQAKVTRKIKLNRNKVTVTVPNVTIDTVADRIVTLEKDEKEKKKTKKKKKKKENEGSDHDEITLQLSDSEKMDLLEDLNEKNYDRLSSSVDSESSDNDDKSDEHDKDNSKIIMDMTEMDNAKNEKTNISIEQDKNEVNKSTDVEQKNIDSDKETKDNTNNTTETIQKDIHTEDGNGEITDIKDTDSKKTNDEDVVIEKDSNNETSVDLHIIEDVLTKNTDLLETTSIETIQEVQKSENVIDSEHNIKDNSNDTSESQEETNGDKEISKENVDNLENDLTEASISEITKESTEVIVTVKEINITKAPEKVVIVEETITDKLIDTNKESEEKKESERDISEGELTDRESSEVEAVDIEPEVVCISDDEKKNKKKKKKDKKHKKEKKSKKVNQDFSERGDQNFYKDDSNLIDNKHEIDTEIDNNDKDEIDINEDVYEILELSDDSSCYEVEGTMISKEPTAEEIEALSAKIDEINEAVDNSNEDKDDTETLKSWKDRYLDSNKVKRVLTTANILNALRKKNKELKKKIQEVKCIEAEKEPKEIEDILEGSIEQYKTLPASTTSMEIEKEKAIVDNTEVQREMKKDAKQLLKMYKKLMNSKKMKRREKKKKRKLKKQKQNEEEVASEADNL